LESSTVPVIIGNWLDTGGVIGLIVGTGAVRSSVKNSGDELLVLPAASVASAKMV